MNINETIFEGIKNSEDLDLYGLRKDNVQRFLLEDIDPQQKKIEARTIADLALRKNEKWPLSKHLKHLMEVESHHNWSRDHVVHSVLTYLLGIFIQENYMVRLGFNIIEPLEWKTAALLHDIGYPLQTAVNNIMHPFGDNAGINYSVNIDNLVNLEDGRNGSVLLNERINSWDLNGDITTGFNLDEVNPTIKHGLISSMMVLNEINKLYIQKPNSDNIDWNFNDFNKYIVNACAAIYVHDDKGISISYEKAPTAFLLKICDLFQEWSRPRLGAEEDKPSEYNIEIENNCLIFYAPKDKLKSIENEIKSLKTEKLELQLKSF